MTGSGYTLCAAEKTVIKVLSAAPHHSSAHLVLGWRHIYSNRAAQGITECEKALGLDQNAAYGHGFIGLAKFFWVVAPKPKYMSKLSVSLLAIPGPRVDDCRRVAKLQLWRRCGSAAWQRRCIEANRNFAFGHFALAAALGFSVDWTRREPQ